MIVAATCVPAPVSWLNMINFELALSAASAASNALVLIALQSRHARTVPVVLLRECGVPGSRAVLGTPNPAAFRKRILSAVKADSTARRVEVTTPSFACHLRVPHRPSPVGSLTMRSFIAAL